MKKGLVMDRKNIENIVKKVLEKLETEQKTAKTEELGLGVCSNMEIAIEKASKVLRREHDKKFTVKGKADDKEFRSRIGEEKIEGVEEIVPMELEIYKPLEVEEALDKLKSSDKQFYVFNDVDAKMRVIYKRTDGTFGLY